MKLRELPSLELCRQSRITLNFNLMNRFILLFVLLIVLGSSSCTDVIEVEVPTAPPRLVIEASIDWQKGTSGNFQQVKLSSSTPFFENLQESPVTDAQVKITNDNDGTEFL